MGNNTKDVKSKNIHVALMENIMNSPLVSLNSNGTESHLTPCPLLYIRQYRDPIKDFEPEAQLFQRMFEKTEDPKEEEWRMSRLMQYEQYFARLEIMNLIWTEEARFRQLIRRHLEPITDLNKTLIQLRMISESSHILDNAFSLVRKVITLDAPTDEQSLLIIKATNRCFSKIETSFLKPLLLIRHGISHGNMRSYISFRGVSVPATGKSLKDDRISRALGIYENADAVVVRALQDSFNHGFSALTYQLLIKKKPKAIRNEILAFAKRSKEFRQSIDPNYPFLWNINLSSQIKNNPSPAIKDACFGPIIAISTLIKDLESQF